MESAGYVADHFAFRVELLSNHRFSSVEQPVIVINVNDPPKLYKSSSNVYSVLAIGVTASSSGSKDDDVESGFREDGQSIDSGNGGSESSDCSTEGIPPCPSVDPTSLPSKYESGDDQGDEEDELVLTDISLEDADMDVDPIKVRVACKYGFLTLEQSVLSALDTIPLTLATATATGPAVVMAAATVGIRWSTFGRVQGARSSYLPIGLCHRHVDRARYGVRTYTSDDDREIDCLDNDDFTTFHFADNLGLLLVCPSVSESA